MTLEAFVPPKPGTNGDVLFFAICVLLLKQQKQSVISKSFHFLLIYLISSPERVKKNTNKLIFFYKLMKISLSFNVKGRTKM